jgi:hypothetical protein
MPLFRSTAPPTWTGPEQLRWIARTRRRPDLRPVDRVSGDLPARRGGDDRRALSRAHQACPARQRRMRRRERRGQRSPHGSARHRVRRAARG